jgi:hypothetical protein
LVLTNFVEITPTCLNTTGDERAASPRVVAARTRRGTVVDPRDARLLQSLSKSLASMLSAVSRKSFIVLLTGETPSAGIVRLLSPKRTEPAFALLDLLAGADPSLQAPAVA